MIALVKIISSEFDTFKRRVVKVLRLGKDDVQTGKEAMPFGVDSSPIKDMVGVFMDTAEKGKPVLVGYLNKNQLAQSGETRLFSLDSQGTLKAYLWLKNDGNLLLNGDADNAVRFSKLEEGFNKLKDDFNNLVTKYNTHTHPVDKVQAGTSLITSSITTNSGTSSTASIAASKIETVKVP